MTSAPPTPAVGDSAEADAAVMAVSDLFPMADGTIAFVGVLPADVPLVRAGQAELVADGRSLGRLRLEGESVPTRRPVRPGNPLPPHLRSVRGTLPPALSADDLRGPDGLPDRLELHLAVPAARPSAAIPSDPRRPLNGEHAEVAFLQQGINCELGENNLVYTLRFGPEPRPRNVWVVWSGAGQEPCVVYRPWETPPAGVEAIGGVTAEGITLLRGAGVGRYAVLPDEGAKLSAFLAAFGITGERADRVRRVSGIAVGHDAVREAA